MLNVVVAENNVGYLKKQGIKAFVCLFVWFFYTYSVVIYKLNSGYFFLTVVLDYRCGCGETVPPKHR